MYGAPKRPADFRDKMVEWMNKGKNRYEETNCGY